MADKMPDRRARPTLGRQKEGEQRLSMFVIDSFEKMHRRLDSNREFVYFGSR